MTTSTYISAAIVLACVAWLGWRGYERGVIRTLQRLVSMVAAYAACYVAMVPVAGWMQAQFSWPLIPSYLASALVCFVGAAVIVEYLVSLLADAVEDRGVEPAHIPGALLGVVLGALLGIVTVWLGGIVLDAYHLQGRDAAQMATPTATQDPVRQLAGQLVGDVVEQTLSSGMDENSLVPVMTSQLLSNPVQLTQQVMQVSQSDAMRAIFADPYAQQLMLAGQAQALQEHPHFQTLMALPEAREILTVLGEGTVTGQDIQPDEKVARLLVDMYQRASRVQRDPRFLKLAEKPEFKQLAQNPSPVAMLTNPVLSELAEIVFDPAPLPVVMEAPDESALQRLEPLEWESLDAAPATVVDPSAPEQAIAEPQGKVMYRWTDENGRKHYSENKPEGDYAVEVIRLSP